MSRFDTILLGDNPFFGVDHLSSERARIMSEKNRDFNQAIEVITCAVELGIKDMMIGTRPKLNDLLEKMKKINLLDKISFHPVIPYAQDYVMKLSEKGLMGTLMETLRVGGFRNELRIIKQGGVGFIKKDLLEFFKTFIDIELLKVTNIKIKTVYLHPLFTDLALSLNMKSMFETFKDHLEKRYKVQAGLCTKNFPMLVSKLDEWQIRFPYIMTSFNKSGFLMNPSRKMCENTLQKYNDQVMAMNIFSGGYHQPKEACDYIFSLNKIRNVVFGATSVEHVKQTITMLKNMN